jgi:SPP1 family predicted phage head-tail adaptor
VKLAAVGAFRERVTLYSQSQTVDAAGSMTTAWTQGESIWAQITPLSANQIVLAGRDDAIRNYVMMIRYRTDINTNSRVIWRGRKFDVQGVTDQTEQRVFLTVYLKEINA